MTVFDRSSITRLAEDVGSVPFAMQLLRSYDDLLDRRVPRVIDAVGVNDVEDALDATLSLKVSSSTVGALELSELAHVVERDLRSGDMHSALSHAQLIPAAAGRARAALTTVLHDPPCAAGACA